MTDKHICQVAFSALNAPALRDWYAAVFGLVKSGKIVFFPPSTSRVQGIPGAWEKCSWLVDQQDYFQLEFFQFFGSRTRLKSLDWRPCDIGYNMVGIAVTDFDQVVRNVCARSGMTKPQIVGVVGERRLCVADPEGNWVEIYEEDPLSRLEGSVGNIVRPEVPAVVRTLRVSVPNLDDACSTFSDAMGLELVEDFQLHTSKDEKRWGLPRARSKSVVLRSTNFLLELVQYSSPAAKPWPEAYSLADQGIMNIAFGYRDKLDYNSAFARATGKGMRPNGEVLDAGIFQVMYVNDAHGFSVEMLNARRSLWSVSGFNPAEGYVVNEIEINASAAEVWRQVTDHQGLGNWTIFSGTVLRPGKEDPGGLGCIRELTAPLTRLTEEITAWDEEAHYAYQLRTGAPFRRHQGDIFLTEENGRTRVRWAIRFESWIPFSNRPLSWVLGAIFKRALKKLKGNMEAYQAGSQY